MNYKKRDQLSLKKTLLSYKSDIKTGKVRASPRKKSGKCHEKFMNRKDDTNWKPCFKKKEYKYEYPRKQPRNKAFLEPEIKVGMDDLLQHHTKEYPNVKAETIRREPKISNTYKRLS